MKHKKIMILALALLLLTALCCTSALAAGGVYNGQWIMATSRWVTRVYAPSKPLPRTGY